MRLESSPHSVAECGDTSKWDAMIPAWTVKYEGAANLGPPFAPIRRRSTKAPFRAPQTKPKYMNGFLVVQSSGVLLSSSTRACSFATATAKLGVMAFRWGGLHDTTFRSSIFDELSPCSHTLQAWWKRTALKVKRHAGDMACRLGAALQDVEGSGRDNHVILQGREKSRVWMQSVGNGMQCQSVKLKICGCFMQRVSREQALAVLNARLAIGIVPQGGLAAERRTDGEIHLNASKDKCVENKEDYFDSFSLVVFPEKVVGEQHALNPEGSCSDLVVDCRGQHYECGLRTRIGGERDTEFLEADKLRVRMRKVCYVNSILIGPNQRKYSGG
ncbi:hypothetical protein SELMODRAFT_408699 [Selaginella moellendorffii]|uniref:Uncharacterized protein n=1 Tax=Selaginella moellendorffii TaxID=88036 RepID=D8R9N9_SELML|nr:hypothetical protein SELMODRAFT_408699 [Selaginella moellendorffii]